MIFPGYHDQGPDGSSYNAWVVAEKETHKKRIQRLRELDREIQHAKRKLMEYDRFLSERGKLQQEEREYFERVCAATRRR